MADILVLPCLDVLGQDWASPDMPRRGLQELSLSVHCLEILEGPCTNVVHAVSFVSVIMGSRLMALCLCFFFFSEKALLSFQETGTQSQLYKMGKFKPFNMCINAIVLEDTVSLASSITANNPFVSSSA